MLLAVVDVLALVARDGYRYSERLDLQLHALLDLERDVYVRVATGELVRLQLTVVDLYVCLAKLRIGRSAELALRDERAGVAVLV